MTIQEYGQRNNENKWNLEQKRYNSIGELTLGMIRCKGLQLRMDDNVQGFESRNGWCQGNDNLQCNEKNIKMKEENYVSPMRASSNVSISVVA